MTAHGRGFDHRVLNGGDPTDAYKRYAHVARCLCGQRFEGKASSRSRAAAKAIKARDKHLEEIRKAIPTIFGEPS